ncbi:MAG: ribonuclease III [Bordetella sp.]|nr:MAG: ribonuclease III [Bordetella sp.]
MCLKNLESRLDYFFYNIDLLELALTHRSYGSDHNERLEFLGDSILNFAVTTMLFDRYKNMNEGNLSIMRAKLVKQSSLEMIAKNLDLSTYLRLGQGEIKSGGNYRSSILANAVEAIFGAIFKDSGFGKSCAVIKKQYEFLIDNFHNANFEKDSKTLLQEFLQSKKISIPTYTLVLVYGNNHEQNFEVECAIPSLNIKVKGVGITRRTAEQSAAKDMLNLVSISRPTIT